MGPTIILRKIFPRSKKHHYLGNNNLQYCAILWPACKANNRCLTVFFSTKAVLAAHELDQRSRPGKARQADERSQTLARSNFALRVLPPAEATQTAGQLSMLYCRLLCSSAKIKSHAAGRSARTGPVGRRKVNWGQAITEG